MMKKSIAFSLLLALLCTALCACTASAPKEINLPDTLKTITADITLPDSMTDMTMDQLKELYGIESSEISQFAGLMTGVGTLADEIVLLEASSTSALSSLQEKINARVESKLAQMRDYLPDEYDKINAKEMVIDGQYIALFISDSAKELKTAFEDSLK